MRTIIAHTRAAFFGLLALIGFFTLACTTPYPAASHSHRWEKLGQRTVNYHLDRDEIPVTLRDGRFTALKLVVRKAPVHLHRVVVHFGNGEHMEISVRKRIPAGGQTRVIDLPGGKRVIRKVVFWYDTKGLPRGKAVVELWGRH